MDIEPYRGFSNDELMQEVELIGMEQRELRGKYDELVKQRSEIAQKLQRLAIELDRRGIKWRDNSI